MPTIIRLDKTTEMIDLGGAGSGFFGHAGRDAENLRGGSVAKIQQESMEDKIVKWKKGNIEIAKNAPKTQAPKDQQKYIDNAYSLGEKARKDGVKSVREAVQYGNYDKEFSSYDFPEFVAFEAGLTGKDKPYWVNGWRYGVIPKSGQSMNFKEGRLEAGLSVMALDNGMATDDPGFEMFGGSRRNGDKIYVSGFFNTVATGGDGEPLLLWATQTGKIKD